jgi:hypothetical protein
VLVKVDADAWASKAANRDKPHPFRIYGDKQTMVKQTAAAVREQFKKYFTTQRNRVFHPDDRDQIYLTTRRSSRSSTRSARGAFSATRSTCSPRRSRSSAPGR